MVGDKLHDEKVQSLKDSLEEVAKLLPRKTKKKKMGKDEAGLSKTKAHERIPFVAQRKGEDEVNVSSLVKTPMAPKKNKRKE
jgi:hypothetical protein